MNWKYCTLVIVTLLWKIPSKPIKKSELVLGRKKIEKYEKRIFFLCKSRIFLSYRNCISDLHIHFYRDINFRNTSLLPGTYFLQVLTSSRYLLPPVTYFLQVLTSFRHLLLLGTNFLQVLTSSRHLLPPGTYFL